MCIRDRHNIDRLIEEYHCDPHQMYLAVAGGYMPVSYTHLTHHTHMVNFVDDTFNVPKARFKTLLEMMIHKRYSFQWHAFIRAQYLRCV